MVSRKSTKVSKGKKVAKFTYVERVLGALSAIQKQHKKHTVHVASIRAQVRKNAEITKDKLGPQWTHFIGKAIHVLEQRGVLEHAESSGNVSFTPEARKAVTTTRRYSPPSPDDVMEEHLWKRVLYDFRDGGSPVRKRKRTSLSTAHDEEEIVTDLVQGARVSGHKAVSKMTKPELLAELRAAQKALSVLRMNASRDTESPLTQLSPSPSRPQSAAPTAGKDKDKDQDELEMENQKLREEVERLRREVEEESQAQGIPPAPRLEMELDTGGGGEDEEDPFTVRGRDATPSALVTPPSPSDPASLRRTHSSLQLLGAGMGTGSFNKSHHPTPDPSLSPPETPEKRASSPNSLFDDSMAFDPDVTDVTIPTGWTPQAKKTAEQNQLVILRDEITSKDHELLTLREDLRLARQDLASKSTSLSEMRALYEERDSAFHSLELRLHELEADKTVLRGELKVAREMIEYEKAQRTEGMGKQAELMRKRDELEVDLIGARQDLSHRDDRITSLEAELVSANEEGAAIKRALEGYRGEVSELESKVEALERSKKEVEASEGEKSAKIIDLEEREREAMRNVEELIQEGKEKDGVNEMLSMEKVEFEQKILELEEKVKHDGSTIKLQEEKIEQLERSLGEILSVEEVVRTQLAASELDKDDAQKGTADLFHQLDQMKQSFEEAARELEESGAERTTLEKEKETLTVQLEVGRAMATAHEASLLTSADTIAKLSSKVSSAEQSAVSLQALLGQSQFESLSFKEQLTASLEQLKKVQERVMVEVGKREEVERRMSAVEGEFGEFKRKVGVMRKRQRQSWIEIDEDVDPTVTDEPIEKRRRLDEERATEELYA